MSDASDRFDASILVDGERVPARTGESVAAAILRTGERVLRLSRSGEARGLFCVMGSCYDCAVRIDGRAGERACVTPVRDGMRISRR